MEYIVFTNAIRLYTSPLSFATAAPLVRPIYDVPFVAPKRDFRAILEIFSSISWTILRYTRVCAGYC